MTIPFVHRGSTPPVTAPAFIIKNRARPASGGRPPARPIKGWVACRLEAFRMICLHNGNAFMVTDVKKQNGIDR
jgi:hypothetical protein